MSNSGGEGFARGQSIVADPYPFFARLRREEPFYRDEDGFLRVTRHEDVVAALKDERLSADDERFQQRAPFAEEILDGLDSPAARARRQWFINLDNPEHRRMRHAVAPAFTRTASASYGPAIQTAIDRLIDGLQGMHQADLLASVLRPLPSTALASAFGFPVDDWEQVLAWVLDVNLNFNRMRTPDEVVRMNRAVVELEAYLGDRIAQATEDPLSTIVGEARRRGLSDDELRSTLEITLTAGQHVMVKLLGACVIQLLSGDGSEQRRLRENPKQIPAFVAEMLRWDSPAQGLKRVATADVELPSGTIRRHEIIVVMLGSANRDEAVFPDPDAFDPTRRDSRPIPFGVGTHFCLGAFLAKLEAALFIETLLRRFDGLAFGEDPPLLPVARRGVPPLTVVWDRLD